MPISSHQVALRTVPTRPAACGPEHGPHLDCGLRGNKQPRGGSRDHGYLGMHLTHTETHTHTLPPSFSPIGKRAVGLNLHL